MVDHHLTLTALAPVTRPGTQCTGGRAGLGAGLNWSEISRPHLSSNPYGVARLTALSWLPSKILCGIKNYFNPNTHYSQVCVWLKKYCIENQVHSLLSHYNM